MDKKVWGKTELVDKVAEKSPLPTKMQRPQLRQLSRSSRMK